MYMYVHVHSTLTIATCTIYNNYTCTYMYMYNCIHTYICMYTIYMYIQLYMKFAPFYWHTNDLWTLNFSSRSRQEVNISHLLILLQKAYEKQLMADQPSHCALSFLSVFTLSHFLASVYSRTPFF